MQASKFVRRVLCATFREVRLNVFLWCFKPGSIETWHMVFTYILVDFHGKLQ